MMIDLKELGFPEVPLVGVFTAVAATPGLVDHLHAGLMEICYLKSGKMIFQVGGKDYVMHGNEVFVTWPDEIHSSGNHPQGRGVLYWMQLRLPARVERKCKSKSKSFLGLDRPCAAPLVRRLGRLPHRHFNGRRELAGVFNRIVRTIQNPHDEMQPTVLANALVQWLLMVIECSNRAIHRVVSDEVQAVLRHIDRHLAEPIALDDLAGVAVLSTSRMKARFREELGMPPHEYILRRRIDRAAVQLTAGGRSVTEVAYDLGFSSSQYFATVLGK